MTGATGAVGILAVTETVGTDTTVVAGAEGGTGTTVEAEVAGEASNLPKRLKKSNFFIKIFICLLTLSQNE